MTTTMRKKKSRKRRLDEDEDDEVEQVVEQGEETSNAENHADAGDLAAEKEKYEDLAADELEREIKKIES